jgi:two-component system sensor histidine kinase UhpB
MFRKRSPALRLALLFFLFSGVWILSGNWIVKQIAGNNVPLIQEMEVIKGLLFVVLCSLLIYFSARSLYRNIKRSLQDSEELLSRYKALSEATKEGIIDCDLETDRAVINEQMKFFMQADTNELERFSVRHKKRIHPDDRQRITQNFEDTLATASVVWQADYRYRLFDGAYHDVIHKGVIIRDEEDRPRRVISSIYHQEVKYKSSLGQSIIKAQEDERNRWAQELHDNVCQLLTVVKLYLEQLSSYPDSDGQLLDRTKKMTEKALNDIRHLSASIKPPEFSITTVQQAIQELLDNIKRVKPYRFDLDFENFCEKKLKDEQKLMIYRVVQEQLNNIMKYAEATLIRIQVKTTGENVYIEVRDNGKGFDPSYTSTGIGLKNIRSRLQVYSGNLVIASAPGQGCKLMADFGMS